MATVTPGKPADSPPRTRLRLRQLEVFVATARGGTTRAAAAQVSRSQSAASAALSELEATLGAPVFDRVGRRLVLNENGRALLPKATALLDRAAEAQNLFSEESSAPLRMAASLTIGEHLLPDLLATWKAAHPASRVQLMIGNTREVVAAVVAFDADIGFIEGAQTHPDLVARDWLTDQLVIVAGPTHPLARRRHVSAAELCAAGWALREPGSGTREAGERWLLDHLGALHIEFELGSPEVVRRVVASGSALGCLSRHAVAQALAEGTLIEVRTKLPPAVRRLAIVLHRDKHLGRGTEAFVTLCNARRRRSAAS